MKIGIMGGTFDPIHFGHLSVAQAARDIYSLEEVWFLPNVHPPHKKEERIVCSGEDRIAMTRLALSSVPYFLLNLHEASDKEISYTCDTLAFFKEDNPNIALYFIIGADSLFEIETWKNPGQIMSLCTILVACRDEVNSFDKMEAQITLLERQYGGRIKYVKTKLLPYSSTEIRFRLKMGMDVGDAVPGKVLSYIYERGLYGCKTHSHTSRAESMLKRKEI